MDEQITYGLIGFGGLVLFMNGIPQKAWAALWGASQPLGGGVPEEAQNLGTGDPPPLTPGNPGDPGPSGDYAPVARVAATRLGIVEFANYCLQWAQNQAISAGLLKGHQFGSAYQAEKSAALNQGCNAPAGAFVWFDQSWDPNGHVGVSDGSGQMYSTKTAGGAAIHKEPYCVRGYAGWSAPR